MEGTTRYFTIPVTVEELWDTDAVIIDIATIRRSNYQT